jgi:hypothetical protein
MKDKFARSSNSFENHYQPIIYWNCQNRQPSRKYPRLSVFICPTSAVTLSINNLGNSSLLSSNTPVQLQQVSQPQPTIDRPVTLL